MRSLQRIGADLSKVLKTSQLVFIKFKYFDRSFDTNLPLSVFMVLYRSQILSFLVNKV